jgi:hypothetical protein
MLDALKRFATRVGHATEHAGLWWGVAISVGLAVVSLAIAAAVVLSWPPDQFKDHHSRSVFWAHRSPAVRIAGLVGKNVAGGILLVLGAIMALPGIPGQGVLTMIIGLTLVDFPGKHALERRLVGRPWVLRHINSLRRRFKQPPLEL